MTSDDSSARQLRRLLSELKASQELERLAERRREAERSAVRTRSRDLHESIVLASIRAFAAELERQGHSTRLERRGPAHERLHVQVQGRRVIEASVDLDWRLEPEPVLRARVRHRYREEASEEVPLDQLDAPALAALWVRLLERLVALANR